MDDFNVLKEVPFNKLTPAESERLALLIEEAGEVIQAATKVLRHGWNSYDPTLPPGKAMSNRASLEKEMGHYEHATRRMFSAVDVDCTIVGHYCDRKADTIGQWMHHQPDSQK